MAKHWVVQAIALLKSSRDPVPYEINELDWKLSLSGNKERLIEHLIAFSNCPHPLCISLQPLLTALAYRL